MDYLKDIAYINKNVFAKTIKSFKKGWVMLFTGIVYTFLNMAIYNLIGLFLRGPLSILSGIISAIVSSAFISNYLYLLYNLIEYNKVTIDDFKDGFTFFLRKMYTILFIAYIGNLLLSLVINMIGSGAGVLIILIYFGVFIFLNALPETIYLRSNEPWDSIVYSVKFMEENWLNWLLPNLILAIILYISTGRVVSGLFNTHLSFSMVFSVWNILLYILGQGIFTFMMVYRGHLFKLLSTSSRRKRMYMNKF